MQWTARGRWTVATVALVCIIGLLATACASSSQPAPATPPQPAAPTAAAPAPLPAAVGIGTFPVGGAYHAATTGVAALITKHTPMRAMVQPYAGPNAWAPELEAGDLAFGLLSMPDAGWMYTGGPGYPSPHKNVRLLLAGNQLANLGLVARKNSGITSLSDLKGKPTASEFSGAIFLRELTTASLASVGLTWDDVKGVPTPSNNSGLQLLQDGRVVVAPGLAPTTPTTVEVDQAVGLVVLPFGNLKPADLQGGVPSQMQAILDKYVPGTTLTVAKAGVGILKEDTVVITYPIVMVASAHSSAETVYAALKAIWENYRELHPVHAWLKEWLPETMPALNPPVPYHEGAIKFFKEAGVWTNQHQQTQDRLLAAQR